MKDYRELWGDLVEGNFPNIRAKNATGPDWQNGTPYTATFIDDIWGFMQAVLDEAGIVPNGESEAAGASQILEALKIILKATIVIEPPPGGGGNPPGGGEDGNTGQFIIANGVLSNTVPVFGSMTPNGVAHTLGFNPGLATATGETVQLL